MFCHKCGAPIAERAVFCEKCGAKVVYVNTETQIPKVEPKQPVAGASSVNPFNLLKIVISVVVIIAVVVLVSSGALGDFIDKLGELDQKITAQTTDSTVVPGIQSATDLFPGLSGATDPPSSNSSESSFAWVEDAHIETLDYGIRYIVGTIKNISDTTFTSASVQFALYDSVGNQIGTTADYISNFKAGNTWKFKAIITSDVAYFEFLHATKVYPKE